LFNNKKRKVRFKELAWCFRIIFSITVICWIQWWTRECWWFWCCCTYDYKKQLFFICK